MKNLRVVALIFLVFSIGMLFGHTTANQAVGREPYSDLRIFTEVLSQISSQYVEPIESKKLLYGAIRGMIKELDPHSSFMTPDMFKDMQVETKGEFGGIGIQLGTRDGVLTVIAPIEDTPAWKQGILSGDQILRVDTKPTKDMTIQEAVDLMRGKPGTQVTISIMRDGFDKMKDITITRAVIHIKSVKQKQLGDGVGHLRITQFQENTTREVREALKTLGADAGTLKGLIIDLRSNPGGLLDEAVGVSSLFVEKGKAIVTIKGRNGDNSREYPSRGGDHFLDTPLIVLIDGGSASASEIVAGALRDWKRALILGTLSFGKGSVQTVSPLSDGSALRLTTALYFTPNGTSIQGKGIAPDILVERVKEEQLAKPTEGHMMKEKDLEGALVNPSGAPTPEPQATPAASPTPGAEVAIPDDDTQLKRAHMVMKSLLLFKGLSQAPTP
jgi:carboxyl-terminal processing protease